ncbi:HNH/ENDO VII family nuclease [Vreelandella sp. EE7]
MSDDQGERDAAGTSGSSAAERQARNGQARHIGNSRPWMVVVSQPDFCRLGDKIIGFDSTATLDEPVRYSPNVVSAGERTYRVGDLCCGTEGNAGAGLVSGTSLGSGYVLFQTGQPNLKINGLAPVRDGSQCLVNCNAAGIGGAQGYVYTNTQGVNSLPECAPAEPMDPVQQEIEQINERAREIDERAQEIDATIKTSLDQLTPDEAGALRLELEQLKQDSKVLQWRYDEVLDALPENHLAGADVLSLYEAESSINTAIDKIPGPLISDEMLERIKYEAKLTVEMSAEVLFAPYGATKDTQAVWGHLSRGEYLAASITGLVGLLSVVPGARLLRGGRGVERAASSAEDVAGSANLGRSSSSDEGLRVEQNSGTVGSSGNSIAEYGLQSEKYIATVSSDGRRVYKNLTDIDPGAPSFVDRSVHRSIRQKINDGWTNVDLMRQGYAPIGSDGKQMNLHHILGQESGPMVELTTTTHQNFSRQLHGLIEDGRSFRNDPVLNRQYNKFRGEWWKKRAEDFQ